MTLSAKENKMENKKLYWSLFTMRGLKRGICFIAFAACFWTTLSSLTGCATTQAISFAVSEHPKGDYKYAVISASTSEGGSVLQRFYSEYPSDKYEVITCELQRKKSLPLLAGLGSGLLGTLIGTSVAMDSDNLASGMAIGFAVPLITFATGYLIGDYFKDTYVITYIERPTSQ
jgi:hypothetical protein